MTTIITRLYEVEDKAVSAASALKNKFGDNAIHLVSPTTAKGADIKASAVKSGIRASDAAAYAEKVKQGQSLVTVHAPWGTGREAIAILESHGGVDAGIGEPDVHVGATGGVALSNDATPFSDWLGWPVLAPFKVHIKLRSNDASPFSDYFKWPVLSDKKPTAKLVNDAAPFSKALNLAVLSDRPPFSTLVKDDRSQVTLSNDPTPFSRLLHLRVLVDDEPL
jgi:hypothetical protein